MVEAAVFASQEIYVTEDALVPQYLADESTLHDVVLGDDGRSFKVTIADARCGTVGHEVGETASDL